VDTDLASSVAGNLPITLDPYLYTLFATARSGCAPQDIEAVMWSQVEQMVLDLATPEELDKALKQAKAHLAYSSESVTHQALWFGFAEILQDYTWFTSFFDRLNRVTREDVRRVAAKYLKRDNCTVGWYVPHMRDGKI
jgi:zinc protease